MAALPARSELSHLGVRLTHKHLSDLLSFILDYNFFAKLGFKKNTWDLPSKLYLVMMVSLNTKHGFVWVGFICRKRGEGGEQIYQLLPA